MREGTPEQNTEEDGRAEGWDLLPERGSAIERVEIQDPTFSDIPDEVIHAEIQKYGVVPHKAGTTD